MDPPIVTGGVLMMITPAAVDGGRHTTALKRRNYSRIRLRNRLILISPIELSWLIPTQLTALMVIL